MLEVSGNAVLSDCLMSAQSGGVRGAQHLHCELAFPSPSQIGSIPGSSGFWLFRFVCCEAAYIHKSVTSEPNMVRTEEGVSSADSSDQLQSLPLRSHRTDTAEGREGSRKPVHSGGLKTLSFPCL